ncbi:MAG: hypothetical protein KME27_09965 [Lyngbya sp. HA4199-MV5]|nr:hypothetical protein [Lyngbya sp. HA4199-MV5]
MPFLQTTFGHDLNKIHAVNVPGSSLREYQALFTGMNIEIGSIALGTVRLLLRGKLLPPAIPVKAA